MADAGTVTIFEVSQRPLGELVTRAGGDRPEGAPISFSGKSNRGLEVYVLRS